MHGSFQSVVPNALVELLAVPVLVSVMANLNFVCIWLIRPCSLTLAHETQPGQVSRNRSSACSLYPIASLLTQLRLCTGQRT